MSTAFGGEDQAAFFTILSPLMRPFMKTTAQGAATSIYLAWSAQVACGRSTPTSSALRSVPETDPVSPVDRRWTCRLHLKPCAGVFCPRT